MTVTLYQIVSEAESHDNGFVPIYDCGLFRTPADNFSKTFAANFFESNLENLPVYETI